MKTDEHLNILLDIQKQLGDVKTETRGQSEMLKALNEKVAIQNGRIYKAEGNIGSIQSLLENWKGKMVIIVAIVGIVGNLIITIIKSKIGI